MCTKSNYLLIWVFGFRNFERVFLETTFFLLVGNITLKLMDWSFTKLIYVYFISLLETWTYNWDDNIFWTMIIISKNLLKMWKLILFFSTLQKNLIFNFFNHRLVNILQNYLNNEEKSLDWFQIKMVTLRLPENC